MKKTKYSIVQTSSILFKINFTCPLLIVSETLLGKILSPLYFAIFVVTVSEISKNILKRRLRKEVLSAQKRKMVSRLFSSGTKPRPGCNNNMGSEGI